MGHGRSPVVVCRLPAVPPAMLALLFLSAAASAYAERQQDACVSITTRIEAVGPLEESQRTSAAYMLCLKQRPHASFLGVTNSAQDCREFAHAYNLAKEFSKASFSAAELCATLHLYAGDAARLAAGVAKPLKANGIDQGVALIDRAACQTHMRKIEQLRLDRKEAASIVQADCPKRFHAQANICMQMGTLFAAGNLAGACQLLTQHRQPPVDMVAVCKRAATKVSVVGLEGEALRRAAADLCVAEIKTIAPQVPQQRTMAGCNFFAKRLEAAQQQGPMDIPHFCMALGSSRQTKASRAKVVAPAAPGSPVAVQPQPHPSTAARSKGNIAALQTPGGASGTDASVVNQGTAMDEVGGTNQQTPSTERHTVELTAKLSMETQASNDFLAGFLDKYDTAGSKTPSSTAAPPAQSQHMVAEMTDGDQKPAETPVPAELAQEVSSSTLPGVQPDVGQLTQLASSFSALSLPDGLLGAGEKTPTVPPPVPASQPAASRPAVPKTEQDAAHEDGEPQQDDFDSAVASFLDNSK
mmetsp:Transcript_132874/g.265145  ORF Transcript_132874/g.265145 Transcript_132874/m.265145 type:complete len:527 (+) Transcript_132874:130-1710(+)